MRLFDTTQSPTFLILPILLLDFQSRREYYNYMETTFSKGSKMIISDKWQTFKTTKDGDSYQIRRTVTGKYLKRIIGSNGSLGLRWSATQAEITEAVECIGNMPIQINPYKRAAVLLGFI